MTRRWLFVCFVAWCGASIALADGRQTWPAGSPLEAVLLSGAPTAVPGAAVFVGANPNASIEICARTPCTSYSLSIEGANGSGAFVAIGDAITESTAAAGACTRVAITTPVKWMRANVTAIDTCTLDAWLHGAPY